MAGFTYGRCDSGEAEEGKSVRMRYSWLRSPYIESVTLACKHFDCRMFNHACDSDLYRQLGKNKNLILEAEPSNKTRMRDSSLSSLFGSG